MIPVAPVFPVLTGRSAVSVFFRIPVAPVLPGLRVTAAFLDFFCIIRVTKVRNISDLTTQYDAFALFLQPF
jgi:hypothetical protein